MWAADLSCPAPSEALCALPACRHWNHRGTRARRWSGSARARASTSWSSARARAASCARHSRARWAPPRPCLAAPLILPPPPFYACVQAAGCRAARAARLPLFRACNVASPHCTTHACEPPSLLLRSHSALQRRQRVRLPDRPRALPLPHHPLQGQPRPAAVRSCAAARPSLSGALQAGCSGCHPAGATLQARLPCVAEALPALFESSSTPLCRLLLRRIHTRRPWGWWQRRLARRMLGWRGSPRGPAPPVPTLAMAWAASCPPPLASHPREWEPRFACCMYSPPHCMKHAMQTSAGVIETAGEGIFCKGGSGPPSVQGCWEN